MKDHWRKIKRLHLFDTLIIFGGRPGVDVKIILKHLRSGEHYTISIRADQSIDIHRTKEGKQKSHQSLLRQPLKKFIERYVRALRRLLTRTRINPQHQFYKSFIVLVPRSEYSHALLLEELASWRKREIRLTATTLSRKKPAAIENALTKAYEPIPMKQAPNRAFTQAIVLRDDGKYYGQLIRTGKALSLVKEHHWHRLDAEILDKPEPTQHESKPRWILHHRGRQRYWPKRKRPSDRSPIRLRLNAFRRPN